ncbi:putative THO complex subunit 7-like [Apostichopus japonicus]|uniref:Putative THO complex subunit 7-like n=1 Tax=Stichopus japonicus TaxID=307972 RepID=A0A2G8KBX4_STIJA|nr:putative THO complex subunit 7-like [Apostichopus japonicus]
MDSPKEEVIRKRLLIEGESGADDRRIGSLLKLFVKWSESDESAEESAATYEKMMSTLAQIEFSMEKKQLINNMNAKEMKHYEVIYQKIESEINEAFDRIAGCKEELNEARRVRRHRQEYDNLARVIQKQPDRKETTKKLEELDRELGSLMENKNTLGRKVM